LKNKTFLFSISFLLLVGFFTLGRAIHWKIVENHLANNKASVSEHIKKDQKRIFDHALEISKNRDLYKYFYIQDAPSLLGIFNAEIEKRDIDTMLITNNKGETITRIPSRLSKGDNIFAITSFGRYTVEEKQFSSFISGQNRPLMLAAGSIVEENEEIIGSLFVAQDFNDDYADKLKKDFLDKEDNIFFFVNGIGVVGASFSDSELDKFIRTNYNSAFDNSKNQDIYSLDIVDQKYLTNSIVVYDPEGTEIGAIILIHKQNKLLCFEFATMLYLALILYLVLWPLIKKKKRFKISKKFLLYYFLSFGILVLYLYLLSAGIIFEKSFKTIEIDKPGYTIYNSTIAMNPAFDIMEKGTPHIISVVIDSGGENINAIELELLYDATKIQVDELIMARSICSSELTIEKNIDSKNGKITLSCIIPNPGFSEKKGILADIILTPMVRGDFSINFGENNKILANDGLATNVLRESYDAYYDIIDYSYKNNLNIYSNSHSNPHNWYNNNIANLSWLCNGDFCDNFVYSIDSLPDSLPIFGKSTKSKNSMNIGLYQDGEYYFHLASVDKEGRFILVDHFKLKIDTTSPSLLDIKYSDSIIKKGEVVRFEFETSDNLSGADKDLFYVKLNNGTFLPTKSPLYVSFNDLGEHNVSIRSFDKAGNITEKTIIINVIK
jgi:hypothetical protein